MSLYGHNKPGRPKLTPEARNNIERRITVAAKRLSITGFKWLEKMMNDEKLDPKVRIQAITMILDRGLGKPRLNIDQKVDITVNGYGNALEAAQRRALARAGGEVLQSAIVHDTAVEVATQVHEEDEAQFSELNDTSANT